MEKPHVDNVRVVLVTTDNCDHQIWMTATARKKATADQTILQWLAAAPAIVTAFSVGSVAYCDFSISLREIRIVATSRFMPAIVKTRKNLPAVGLLAAS